MSFESQEEIRSVNPGGGSIREMEVFIQGVVYGWIRDRPEEMFALRDLMGGPNWEWDGTPLYPLFEKHRLTKNGDDAMKAAAKDAGWILKKVLSDDKRTFTRGDAGMANGYSWIGNEP